MSQKSSIVSAGASRHRVHGSWIFARIVWSLAALSLFLQSVTAGEFIADKHDHLAFTLHMLNAFLATILVLAALIAVVLIRATGRGPAWPIAGSAVVLALVLAEIAVGFARVVPLHIPLAVAIIAVAVGMAVWTWLPHPALRGDLSHSARKEND